MLCVDSSRDCSGNRLMLVFRPLIRSTLCGPSCLLGLTTCRMFRLCSEGFNYSSLDPLDASGTGSREPSAPCLRLTFA
jgi:hypothetical protein